MAVYDGFVGETDIGAERRECEEREICTTARDVTSIDDNSGQAERTKNERLDAAPRAEEAH